MYGCDCDECKLHRAEVPSCGCGDCAPACSCTNCGAPLTLHYFDSPLQPSIEPGVVEHPEAVGRRWEGAHGPLAVLLAALRTRKPLCFTGGCLVRFDADVPDADLWRAQATMVLDQDDLAGLEKLAAELAEHRDDDRELPR